MFTDLKPYDAYRRRSGLEQPVPASWDVCAMRTLLRSRSERGRPDLPLLSVARERGVFVRSADDGNHNVIPDDLNNYKVARAGDLVINKMKAWQGSLGLAPCDGVVSPAYFVYALDIADSYYAQALLRSRHYVARFAAASDGVRVGQWDLSVPAMRSIPVLLPTASEQRQIVRYLAHANARIDRAIAAKRKLIALLEEQTRAAIQEAALRGLDRSLGTKDSGVSWIGRIPCHWDVLPARRLVRAVNRRHRDGSEVQLSMRRGLGLVPTEQAGLRGAAEKFRDDFFVCEPGDLVMNKYRASLGMFWTARERGLITPNYTVLSPVGSVKLDYLQWLFQSVAYCEFFARISQGVGDGMSPLYTSRFYATPVLLPPPDERDAISTAILTKRAGFAGSQRRLEREIDLLREFRDRLTADVVTGQVDVREIAASLPELDPADLAPDVDTDGIDEVAADYLDEDGS